MRLMKRKRELTYEVELRFSQPLMPWDDHRAGLPLFVVVWNLFESDVEDDAARCTDTGYDQHQTLHDQVAMRDVREWFLHSHSRPFPCNQFPFPPIAIPISATIPIPIDLFPFLCSDPKHYAFTSNFCKKKVCWKLQFQSLVLFVTSA